MSDYILKFWPKEDIKESKVEKIIEGLTSSKIIGDEEEYYGKPAYSAGELLKDHLDTETGVPDSFFEPVRITIADQDYGVEDGEDDYVFIDRNNVVSVLAADGRIESWDKMCKRLEEITGDQYVGGWEIL